MMSSWTLSVLCKCCFFVLFLVNAQLQVQGVPKNVAATKKVHSFLNTTDITKIFYAVVVLL